MKTAEFSLSPGMVTVCGWCYPSDSILEVAPQFKGLRISHGICDAHKRQVMATIPKAQPPVAEVVA